MSVQSEINRIKTAIASAYSSVSAKGGTVPPTKTAANLPNAISSIPQSGAVLPDAADYYF